MNRRGLLPFEQSRKDRCAFYLHGLELVGVESQGGENGGSKLGCFHRAGDRPGVKSGVRYENHHVGVVVREPTMLGLLLSDPLVFPTLVQIVTLSSIGMASARRFQHANLNAPVLRAPLRGLVVRDRVILSKTYDGNPKQRDVLAYQVTLHCFGSALAKPDVVLLGSRGVRESLHFQHVAGALP